MIAFQPQLSAAGACPNPGGGICAAPAGASTESCPDAAAEFALLLASLAGEAPGKPVTAADPQQEPARERARTKDQEGAEEHPALAAPVMVAVLPPEPPPPVGAADSGTGFATTELGIPGMAADPQAAQTGTSDAAPAPPRVPGEVELELGPEAPLPQADQAAPRRELSFRVKLEETGAAAPSGAAAPAGSDERMAGPARPKPEERQAPNRNPEMEALQDPLPDSPAKAPAASRPTPEPLEPKSPDAGPRAQQTSAGRPAPMQPPIHQPGPPQKQPPADQASAGQFAPTRAAVAQAQPADAPRPEQPASAAQPAPARMPAGEPNSADLAPRTEQSAAARPAPARASIDGQPPVVERDFREPGQQGGRDRAEQMEAPRPAPKPHEEAAPAVPRPPHSASQPNPAPAAAESGRPVAAREPAAQPRADAPRTPELRPIEEPVPAAPRQPVRDFSVVVPDRRGETRSAGDVELRISERGGRVQVAVHTADPGLKDALRERLPELVSRLEDTGYRTQTWRPDTAGEMLRTPAAAAAGEMAGRESGDRSGRDTSGGSGGGQPGNPEHRDRRQDERGPHPRWIEALEDNLDEQSARSFFYVR